MKYRACIWVEIEAPSHRTAERLIKQVMRRLDDERESSHVRTDFPLPEPRVIPDR